MMNATVVFVGRLSDGDGNEISPGKLRLKTRWISNIHDCLHRNGNDFICVLLCNARKITCQKCGKIRAVELYLFKPRFGLISSLKLRLKRKILWRRGRAVAVVEWGVKMCQAAQYVASVGCVERYFTVKYAIIGHWCTPSFITRTAIKHHYRTTKKHTEKRIFKNIRCRLLITVQRK